MALFLTWAFIGLGFLILAVATFWRWFQVTEEAIESGSPKKALWYLWQPYAIYYEITHWKWSKMRGPYLLLFVGIVLILIGTVIGWKSKVLPP